MSLVIGCFNLLLLWALWHFFLRQTIIDGARDALFDLRDNACRWFRDHGEDLSGAPHQALRNSLNAYLYSVQHFTLASFMIGMYYWVKSEDWQREYADYESRFHTENEVAAKYIQRVRLEASMTLLRAMALRSLPLFFLFAFLVAAAILWFAFRWLFLRVSKGVGDSWQYCKPAVVSIILMTPLLSSPYLAQNRTESYSVHNWGIAKQHAVRRS